MIDIKRLHEVHYQYPSVTRGKGKTTYCFDSLLRAYQTEQYKDLVYITNNSRAAIASLKEFIVFLSANQIPYLKVKNELFLNGVFKIRFSTVDDKYLRDPDGFIEDIY